MTERVSVGFLHPGTYASCFADSLTGLLLHDAAGPGRIVTHSTGQLVKRCGSGGIVDGRNTIAKAVCDNDTEWLFMVDSDMGFDPDVVDRFLEHANPDTRPVVGGLAFALRSDGHKDFGGVGYRCVPTIYDFTETDTEAGFVPRLDYERDALVEAGATGGAFMFVHRSAFEAVRDRYGETWFDTIRHPKGAHFSEDLSFCVRLAACDVPLHIHTGIKSTHDKGGVYLDERAFDEQQARLAFDEQQARLAKPCAPKMNRAQRRAAARA